MSQENASISTVQAWFEAFNDDAHLHFHFGLPDAAGISE
jgi:hypothetical protein